MLKNLCSNLKWLDIPAVRLRLLSGIPNRVLTERGIYD